MTTSPRVLTYLAMSILFWLAVALGLFAHLGGMDVAAAPSEPQATATPEPIKSCEPINSAGLIVVFRCVPDQGASYLLNSMGFMMVED